MCRVLQIANYYPPHVGGIEQTARDIVKATKDSFEIKTICFNGDKGTLSEVVDGAEVIRVNVQKKIRSQQIGFEFGKQLRKVMKEFKPEIVIFHYPNPFQAFYFCKYLKKRTFKFILWWHLDITKQKVLGKLFVGQNNKLLEYADKIVATSPNYIESSPWLSAHKEKCEVISSCVNEQRLAINETDRTKAAEIKAKYKDAKICFACGRHVEYKGMRYLIEASKYLSDDYKILIGGKGPLTEKLMELAEGDSKVVFLGKISDDDLKAYLLACDVFCFPSVTKNEAFGLSLAEAMYLRKPAVTFTIEGSGVNYVNLNGVTGIEVPNQNSKAFADAIVKICEDDGLRERYAEAAEKRVKSLCSFSLFSHKASCLMQKLLQRR